ncbi:akirin [Drosophila serrata]|uniref:akirin n=1 Tax=Drosophila serrata TaxID=7274 RepID=UPI000A1D337F|nr:akirin [Drosophila serrata]
MEYELKAPRKRKQGQEKSFIDFMEGLPVLLDSDSSDLDTETQTTRCNTDKIITKDNRNMFSYQQLKDMCFDLMEQTEDRLREEYEVQLTKSMAEQYDTFIKFTQDQMYRELGYNPSYLS